MEDTSQYDLLKNALEQIATFGTAPTGASHLVDIGTDEYLRYFKKEVLDDLISNGGSTCKFYEGAYGSGKSHILQLLRQLSLKNNMVVASTDLSQELALSQWKLITEHILQNMEANINGQITRGFPEILAAVGKKQNALNIERLKKENLPCQGFKNAIVYALHGDKLDDSVWDMLKQYLLGRNVASTFFKNNGLMGIKGNLTQRNAEYILKTVLGSLYYLGFKGTILLFDENEKTLENSSRTSFPLKKNIIAANLIRRMIDSSTNGLLIGTVAAFAVLPEFLNNCAMNYSALGQRLQIFRSEAQGPIWRSPVIPVNLVNSACEPEEFLKQSVKKYINIVSILGGDPRGLEGLMLERGEKVLEYNVGAGYKRELVKALANLAINRV